jgi:putative heme-binding domain-containing protein
LPRAVERLLGRRDGDLEPAVTLVNALTGRPGAANLAAARRAFETLADRVQDGEIAGPALVTLCAALDPIVQARQAAPDDAPLSIETAVLATAWKDATAAHRARRVFRRPAHPHKQRLEALESLVAVRDAAILDDALAVIADRAAGPPEFRGQVLARLGRLEEPRVAVVVLARYAQLEAEIQPRAIELLTERPAWSLALLEAVDAGRVPADALDLNQIRKLLRSKHAELVRQVRARYGTVREGRSPAREQVIDRMRSLLRPQSGDPYAGAAVFKKLCAQCHKIHGEGQDVGPDLTSNGRGSYEQLLSNVFDPSLVIGAAYQATTVATRDGRVLTGLLAEESAQHIGLKIQGGKLETIARDDVEELKLSPLSLMPEDLEKQLSEQELADLFAFLTRDKPPGDPSARPIPGAAGSEKDKE